jgi:hypothetical protein
MKAIRLIILLYCSVSVINGCSLIIEKIIPGEKNNGQEMNVTETELLSQEMVTNDTDQLANYPGNTYIKQFGDAAGPVETHIHDRSKSKDSNVINTIPPKESNYTYKKSKRKTPPFTVNVCTGEKVSRHWHDLKKVVVVTNLLNIRSNYGSDQSVIGAVKRCEQLLVIDKHIERIQGSKRIQSRGWLKIQTETGTTGWVAGWHTRYVDN